VNSIDVVSTDKIDVTSIVVKSGPTGPTIQRLSGLITTPCNSELMSALLTMASTVSAPSWRFEDDSDVDTAPTTPPRTGLFGNCSG
jgi:hypothetical protein